MNCWKCKNTKNEKVKAEKILIDESESSEEIFETINKRFDDDNRSDLSNILGDEKPKFLEFIEERTNQSRADIEISEGEGLIASVTKFLRGLFR